MQLLPFLVGPSLQGRDAQTLLIHIDGSRWTYSKAHTVPGVQPHHLIYSASSAHVLAHGTLRA
jgi:hypothetical protein